MNGWKKIWKDVKKKLIKQGNLNGLDAINALEEYLKKETEKLLKATVEIAKQKKHKKITIEDIRDAYKCI